MDCDTREIYGTYQEGVGEPIQVNKIFVFLMRLLCRIIISFHHLAFKRFLNFQRTGNCSQSDRKIIFMFMKLHTTKERIVG